MNQTKSVPFFRRTSTHLALDSIFGGNFSFNKIKGDFIARGHKRRESDIKYMLNYLERVGLINTLVQKDKNDQEITLKLTDFGEKVKSFRDEMHQMEHPGKLKIIVGAEILKQFYDKGFLLFPFLKALEKPGTGSYPPNNQMIAARFFQISTEVGHPNLAADTDYNDFVSSMKNFAVYLGFANREKNSVKLTDYAKEILKTESDTIVNRKKCNVELCRKVCPAEAIYTDYISNCVTCGLCLRCCPYGAISYVNRKISFNFNKCEQQLKCQQQLIYGVNTNLNELIAEECTMQRWILNLLRISKMNAIIPGAGIRPDIVLNRKDNSSIFECKNEPIRGKKLQRLKFQLESYMDKKIVSDMTQDLSNNWQFHLKTPDVFFVCAPKSSDKDFIIRDLGQNLPYPVSFVSTEAMFVLHQKILERANIPSSDIETLFSMKKQDISTQIEGKI